MNCTASSATDINSGIIDVLPGAAIPMVGTLNYSCTNSNGSTGWVYFCFGIKTGSGGGGYDPRQLANGSNKLNYQIYQDAARTQIWGDRSSAYMPVILKVNVGKKATVAGQMPLYGLIAGGQSTAFAGNYSSAFSSGNTEIVWNSTKKNTIIVPNDCNKATPSGSFDFAVAATVDSRCYATTSTLDFGSVSSLATGQVTGQATINLQCTNGTTYKVGLDNGQNSTGGTNRSMANAVTGTLVRYDLYQDAARSVRWGNTNGVDTLNGQSGTGVSTPITVYGQAYPNATATAGDYSDTIAIAVYF
ncbi:MAG: spore coat U domain-containing protein [Paralcaligenes sp.]